MDVLTEGDWLPLDFSKRIRRLRQQFGFSPSQFADFIEVSVPLLKQWERGQARPGVRYWQQIVLAETEGVQVLDR